MLQYNTILTNGLDVISSGTASTPKTIHRTPKNIQLCSKVAVKGQKILPSSKILTVTKLTHAGGSLLQTIPAWSVGAKVTIVKFNPYMFLELIKDHTHTFLPPAMMLSVTKTKGWANANLEGIRILGGSDYLNWDLIEQFVDKGAIVQPNWGMSEVGPFCINTEYSNFDQINKHKKNGAHILGDNFYVDYKIEKDELIIKSNMCIHKGWFATGDLVYEKNDVLYYKGRK